MIKQYQFGRVLTTWGIKPRNSLGDPPTQKQLAALAATMAKTSTDNFQHLCSKALDLWFTSFEAIQLQKQCDMDHQQYNNELEVENVKLPLPRESEFPMNHDNFLKFIWPKKNTGARAANFKAWLSSLGENVDKEYPEARKKLLDKGLFCLWRDSLFYFHGKSLSKTRSDIARKSWEKTPKRKRRARPPRNKAKTALESHLT